MVIVLMGSAEAGTTTVGTALADRLGWMFVDADNHHSPTHQARLAAGAALGPADRAGWIERLRALIGRALDRRESMVLACSPLAHDQRHRLVDGLRPVRIVELGSDETPGAAHDDTALVLDGVSEVDARVRRIRLAFGV